MYVPSVWICIQKKSQLLIHVESEHYKNEDYRDVEEGFHVPETIYILYVLLLVQLDNCFSLLTNLIVNLK